MEKISWYDVGHLISKFLIVMNVKMNWIDKEAHQKTNEESMNKLIIEMTENEKADEKDSEENHGDTTMECHFVLNYAGTDEEQLVMLSKNNYKDLCDETDDEQESYGF